MQWSGGVERTSIGFYSLALSLDGLPGPDLVVERSVGRFVGTSSVDLVRGCSNLSDQVERLRTLLKLPRTARRERRPRTAKQAQTRLDSDEVAGLVAAYRAGGRVKQLARQFGIHRLTVSSVLQREGVALRPRGIHPDDLAEVTRLYQDGWALAAWPPSSTCHQAPSPTPCAGPVCGSDAPDGR
jgi:hypothetical protein